MITLIQIHLLQIAPDLEVIYTSVRQLFFEKKYDLHFMYSKLYRYLYFKHI